MQLTLVFALAFVAACSARTLGSDNYLVDVGKEYITVTGYGKKVNFLVDQYYGYEGPQTILVQFYGQEIAPKTVQYLDQQGTYQGQYQSDILYQIFTKYAGQLDNVGFEKLLNVITTYVQNGQINPAVLYALQALFGQYEALYQFEGLQGLYQQTPYNKYESFYGQNYPQGYTGYNKYQKESQYGVGAFYPAKYGATYGKNYYGGYYPYGENTYQYSKGQYPYGYAQKYYGNYGPYANQAYQYGKNTYGSDQEYYGKQYYGKQHYGQQFYGPYASQSYEYGSEYPQQYYGGYPYAAGKTYQYGSYYPQQYAGSYGPYASNAYNYLSAYRYGNTLPYQQSYQKY